MNLTKKQLTIYYISIMFFLFSITFMLIICCSKNRDNGYLSLNNNSDDLDDSDDLDNINENINKTINQKLETIEENIGENVDTDYDYDNDSLCDV